MCSLRSRYASLLAALAILTGVVLIGAVDTLLDPRGSDRWSRMSERIIAAVSRTMLGNIAISRARMEALCPTGAPPGRCLKWDKLVPVETPRCRGGVP